MAWMNDVFGGSYSNPANAAQPYLDKIPGYTEKYTQSYIDRGNEAGDIAQEQYAKLAGNPSGVYNDIYANYNESPSYQYESDQLSKAAENSAAAGGYAGTETDYNRQMQTQNALQDEDFSKYMNYIMQLQNEGLSGEQQMYGTGYNASTQALNDMIKYATTSANNQFQGTNASNQMSSGMLSGLMNAAGLGAGLYSLGGGASGLGAMGAGAGAAMPAGYGTATAATLPLMLA